MQWKWRQNITLTLSIQWYCNHFGDFLSLSLHLIPKRKSIRTNYIFKLNHLKSQFRWRGNIGLILEYSCNTNTWLYLLLPWHNKLYISFHFFYFFRSFCNLSCYLYLNIWFRLRNHFISFIFFIEHTISSSYIQNTDKWCNYGQITKSLPCQCICLSFRFSRSVSLYQVIVTGQMRTLIHINNY